MAKRMMLVPFIDQKGGALRPYISQPSWEFHVGKPPNVYPENALDTDMNTILKNTKTKTAEKYKQYQDAIQRRRIKSYKKDHPPKRYIQKRFGSVTIKALKEKLINNVPRWNRDKAKKLYDFILKIPQLSINEYDEILINDERIENSNIVDLFVDMSSEVFKNESLPGQEQFMNLLIRNGISVDVIGNSAYQRRVIEQIPPTPVTPRYRDLVAADDITPTRGVTPSSRAAGTRSTVSTPTYENWTSSTTQNSSTPRARTSNSFSTAPSSIRGRVNRTSASKSTLRTAPKRASNNNPQNETPGTVRRGPKQTPGPTRLPSTRNRPKLYSSKEWVTIQTVPKTIKRNKK